MKKALKITGSILVAFLLILILTPFLFQERIEREVKNLANRKLKSELNFTKMDLSFFSHFPNLTLTLTGFSLKSSSPFDKDTLIGAREIAFGVNVKSLFEKTIIITRVYLDQARINILYNEKGAANFDVYNSGDSAKDASDTTTSSGAELNIERIIFKNCQVIYADPAIPVRVVAHGLNYAGTSKITNDFFNLTSDVRIEALDLVYAHTTYLDSKPVTAQLSTKVNTRTLSVNFEKNDLKIKDIPIQFHGNFNFEKEGYQVSLNFLSIMEREFLSARFKVRQSKHPWIFAKVNASIDLAKWSKALDVKMAELRGMYDLNLNAEGYYVTGPVKKGIRNETDTVILSIPKFNLMTKLTGGYLKYRDLPQALSKINFSLDASCPDNNYKNIVINLENLQANFLKNQIMGFFRLTSVRDRTVDAHLSAGCNLAELKQVFPMDSIDFSGMLDFDVNVKGSYLPEKKKFPVTSAQINLKNGSVRTKYYPHPVEKIEIVALATDPTGKMKDLSVKIRPLTFQFEGKTFTMQAALEDFDDLRYEVQSHGVIDLGRIYKVFSRKGLELDGHLETDLSLKGKQSDANAGRYEKLHNSGLLKLRNIAMTSEDYPRPFIIKTGDFRFDQDKIWFDNFLANYGASDFRLKGFMQNTISYILSQGGILKGNFQLNSDLITVDEFTALAPVQSSAQAIATVETGVVIIPRDLDINFKAEVKKTTLRGLEINDLKGEIDLEEGILVLKETGFNIIGCRVAMDATYGSVTPVKGFFDFHIKAVDFDIKRAYNEVAMIREMAPSAGKAEGVVSLDYSVKGMLDARMFPVLPSLEGGGVFSIKKVKIYGLKLFNDISKGTQKEGLSNPDLSKVDINSTIRNNTVTLEQFKFKVKGIRVRISGTTTFDSKLNLRVRLGLGPLGIIGIPMKVTGPMDNLKIKYGRGKDTENIPDSAYSDQLPQEMLDRIKNAKSDEAEDEPEQPK
jgi:AsmA protein